MHSEAMPTPTQSSVCACLRLLVVCCRCIRLVSLHSFACIPTTFQCTFNCQRVYDVSTCACMPRRLNVSKRYSVWILFFTWLLLLLKRSSEQNATENSQVTYRKGMSVLVCENQKRHRIHIFTTTWTQWALQLIVWTNERTNEFSVEENEWKWLFVQMHKYLQMGNVLWTHSWTDSLDAFCALVFDIFHVFSYFSELTRWSGSLAV